MPLSRYFEVDDDLFFYPAKVLFSDPGPQAVIQVPLSRFFEVGDAVFFSSKKVPYFDQWSLAAILARHFLDFPK